jgi:toxin YoeB
MVAPRTRNAVFRPEFLEDLRFFIATDRKLALRLIDLIQAILRDAFVGIGKPEPLKALGADVWSRRLNDEHRVVYVIRHDEIIFVQSRYHY